jgi:predicted Zn finger-like uncharacterized protein
MVTSCPACTTTFRVLPEQLQRRAGKVRCGQCRSVFDAFKSLASMPDEALPEAPPFPAAEPPSATTAEPVQQPLLDIGLAPASAAHLAAADTKKAPRLWRRLLWPTVALVLALLLLAQLAVALRERIASAAPVLHPMVAALCRLAGCTVSPPKRSDLLAIVASDLQADPARPSRIVLTAALRNRGTSVVAHPAIELTLTNAQDQALVRRIFLPADYLPQAQDVARGMSGLAEVNVRIELDTGELRPAGYRLFLFYP